MNELIWWQLEATRQLEEQHRTFWVIKGVHHLPSFSVCPFGHHQGSIEPIDMSCIPHSSLTHHSIFTFYRGILCEYLIGALHLGKVVSCVHLLFPHPLILQYCDILVMRRLIEVSFGYDWPWYQGIRVDWLWVWISWVVNLEYIINGPLWV